MPKLHELLAVEGRLRTQLETCRKDLTNTFEKKQAHFMEKKVTFKSNKEGIEPKTEEQLGLQTSVHQELDWIKEKWVSALDVAHQIDMANLKASADVILDDGTVLLKDIPATSLLQLEKRLLEVQSLVQAIPTLDPSKGFTEDKDRGDGIFKAREIEKTRTEKKFTPIVMYPHTDKHPAQVKELMEDVPTGIQLIQEWSSLITVAEKGEMLDRVEELTRAIKKARSRANDIDLDVKENKIGEKMLSYVFNPKKKS